MNGNDFIEIIEANIMQIEEEFIQQRQAEFDEFANKWAEESLQNNDHYDKETYDSLEDSDKEV